MPESKAACVFRIDFLRNVFVAACVIAIALPLLNALVIYPAFIHELEAETEDSGVRMARYLSRSLGGTEPLSLGGSQTQAFRETLDSLRDSFGFVQVKVYSPEGTPVYSQDKEAPDKTNESEAFRSVVNTRKPFSKTVFRHGETQERQTVDTDVVETYVPLIADGELLGVIEFYFDVTARKHALDRILLFATAGVTLFAAVLFCILLLTLRRAAASVLDRDRAEAAQRRLNEELAQANERLMELDLLKTAFLSSVSHELRTPLTSILGFIRLTRKDFSKHFTPLAKDDTTVHKARRIENNLDVIALEGGRLMRLVNSVLDLHKIEAGKMEWHMASEDVNGIARRSALAMSSLFEEKSDVALRLDLTDALPPVLVDADRIEQVLLNLLSNAAKFTRSGSVTLSTRQKNGMVELAVADTGNGIRPDELESVFETYYQTAQHQGASPEKFQGTGLGLAICRQIVEHHQGRIRATSVFGEGSVFSFTLPIADTDTAPSRLATAEYLEP